MAIQNKSKLHIKASLTLALIVLVCSAVHAEIYKIVDENGRITFTDKPRPNQNAKTVELLPLNTQPTHHAPTSTPNKKAAKSKAPSASIAITAPTDGTTIPTGQRTIPVNAAVKPYLTAGQRIQLYLDGTPKGSPQAGGHYTLTEVYRGQHTIQAAIVDKHGKAVSHSKAITIYVKRQTAPKPNPAK